MYSRVQGRSAQSGTSHLGLRGWGVIVGIQREAQTPETLQRNPGDFDTSLHMQPVESHLELSWEPGVGNVRQKTEAQKKKKKTALYCFFQVPHYAMG